jgi:hypothetical protein
LAYAPKPFGSTARAQRSEYRGPGGRVGFGRSRGLKSQPIGPRILRGFTRTGYASVLLCRRQDRRQATPPLTGQAAQPRAARVSGAGSRVYPKHQFVPGSKGLLLPGLLPLTAGAVVLSISKPLTVHFLTRLLIGFRLFDTAAEPAFSEHYRSAGAHRGDSRIGIRILWTDLKVLGYHPNRCLGVRLSARRG